MKSFTNELGHDCDAFQKVRKDASTSRLWKIIYKKGCFWLQSPKKTCLPIPNCPFCGDILKITTLKNVIEAKQDRAPVPTSNVPLFQLLENELDSKLSATIYFQEGNYLYFSYSNTDSPYHVFQYVRVESFSAYVHTIHVFELQKTKHILSRISNTTYCHYRTEGDLIIVSIETPIEHRIPLSFHSTQESVKNIIDGILDISQQHYVESTQTQWLTILGDQ